MQSALSALPGLPGLEILLLVSPDLTVLLVRAARLVQRVVPDTTVLLVQSALADLAGLSALAGLAALAALSALAALADFTVLVDLPALAALSALADLTVLVDLQDLQVLMGRMEPMEQMVLPVIQVLRGFLYLLFLLCQVFQACQVRMGWMVMTVSRVTGPQASGTGHTGATGPLGPTGPSGPTGSTGMRGVRGPSVPLIISNQNAVYLRPRVEVQRISQTFERNDHFTLVRNTQVHQSNVHLAGRTEQTVLQKHVHQNTHKSFGVVKYENLTYVRSQHTQKQFCRIEPPATQQVVQMHRTTSVKKLTNVEKPTLFTLVRNSTVRKYSTSLAQSLQSTFVRFTKQTTKIVYNISKDVFFNVTNSGAQRQALAIQALENSVQSLQTQFNALGSLSSATSRLLFQGQSAVTLTGTSHIVID